MISVEKAECVGMHRLQADFHGYIVDGGNKYDVYWYVHPEDLWTNGAPSVDGVCLAHGDEELPWVDPEFEKRVTAVLGLHLLKLRKKLDSALDSVTSVTEGEK